MNSQAWLCFSRSLISFCVFVQLGVTKTETPSSSGSAVLAGILVSGLLLAAGITIGYCKCLRKTDPKGAKLVSTFSAMSEYNDILWFADLRPPCRDVESS